MTASTLPYTSSSGNWALGTGMSANNAYQFNPYTYTGGTLTPLCTGTNVAVTGVTTAASAYDWFALITGGSNALFTAYGLMSTASSVAIQNKAFVAAIAQEARTALLPLVKAEYFALTLAPVLITTISDEVNAAVYSLTTIQTAVDAATKTALAAAYNAEAAVITSALTRLKSLENKIYAVGDSIDVTSTASNTAYAAITNLASLTGAKIYLSTLFDPATLGNGGTAIPALTTTATVAGNAGTLLTAYNNVATALTASTTIKQLIAATEMSAQTLFDLYCGEIQGYTSAGTTGNWASGSAPVGIIPGMDYEVHITGSVQLVQVASNAAAVTAAAGTIGAPSVTTLYL